MHSKHKKGLGYTNIKVDFYTIRLPDMKRDISLYKNVSSLGRKNNQTCVCLI